MRAPDFWMHGKGLAPRLLAPIGAIYAGATARRVARPNWRAPVPVICCGAASVGGDGKTPVALDVGRRLAARGVAIHYLTRGYGGSEIGPVLVDPARHDSRTVGDEALLLATVAPTWVARSRAEGAKRGVEQGAQAFVMDDGLQHPTLGKDLTLLIVSGATGFGNGRVIPAGPLREPVEAALARVDAAVVIGRDGSGAAATIEAASERRIPILRARNVPGPETAALRNRRVFAWAGIAWPQKFFDTLTEAGAILSGREVFADHYPYDEAEIEALLEQAARLDSQPVTTMKDTMRIPPKYRSRIASVSVRIAWDDEAQIEALLDATMARAGVAAAEVEALAAS